MARLLQLRRGTAADWTSNNPTLANGEPGIETDTGLMKIGDGSTAWTSLDYVAGGTTLAILTGLTPAANTFPYFTGAGAGALANISSYIRSLLNLADEPALKSAINLEIGTDVEAYVAPQAEATWEAGVGTTESKVSPAKVAAAIAALESNHTGKPDAIAYESQTSGVEGGTFASGSWTTRVLNSEWDPSGVASVDSMTNQVTFTKDGWLKASCPVFGVNQIRARIYNVTDSTVDSVVSPNDYASNSNSGHVRVETEAPIIAGKAYRVENYCLQSKTTNGLGVAAGITSFPEHYTVAHFWRDHQE